MEITETQRKEIRIFEQVLGHVNQIIPSDRFYVALYDRRNASLYFPVVQLEDGTKLTLSELEDGPWSPRPFIPDEKWPDCLWRSDVDVPNDSGPQTWLADNQIDYQPASPPRSWLIAPLKARGGAVMGVLVAEDLHRERAYGDDLRTWFAAAANRVAGTLSSLRLVESLRAVNRVGQRLTAGPRQSVAEILELIHTEAGQLMDTRDMFVALFDAPTGTLSFPLFYIDDESVEWPSRKVHLEDPAQRKLTEEVLYTGEVLNVPNFSKWFEERDRPVPAQPPKSWLGVPLKTSNRTLGVIALQNDEVEGLYSADDQEILEAMASQVSAALANAQLVERLQAVNEVGQRLTSGARLGENEILQLIYEQAGKLMDTRNMFVAFYDAAKQELSFPLAYHDGEAEEWPSRKLLEYGVTEEVIRTREPLNLRDYQKWYADRELEPPVKPEDSPTSWLGVPLMIEDRVLGVISLQNDEIEGLYGPDDVAVLQAMASQASFAVLALENARLYRQLALAYDELKQAQEQKLWAELGKTAGSLAHRIGNKSGLIRVSVTELIEHLQESGSKDELLYERLDIIERSNRYLLEMSDLLFKPVEAAQRNLEELNVSLLISDAVRSASIPEDVNVEVKDSVNTLPKVLLSKAFVEVFVELINNALDAMTLSHTKKIVISGREIGNSVEIKFTDTGPGIAPDEQEVLFDLFTRLSDKQTTAKKHRGFGLWWVKSYLASIQGDISYESEPGKGATFIVKLPIK